MNYVSALIRFSLAAVCAYLTWHYIHYYHPADPLGYTPPFVLWVIDTINLFIHEAGHLFFKVLGQTVSILGGSLLQCLIPLALTIVTWREKPHQTGYPLFWFGGNLVNVSVYVADAPYKNLRLIKEGLIHDWHWLLSDNLDAAEPLSIFLRWSGIIVCAIASAIIAYEGIRAFRAS